MEGQHNKGVRGSSLYSSTSSYQVPQEDLNPFVEGKLKILVVDWGGALKAKPRSQESGEWGRGWPSPPLKGGCSPKAPLLIKNYHIGSQPVWIDRSVCFFGEVERRSVGFFWFGSGVRLVFFFFLWEAQRREICWCWEGDRGPVCLLKIQHRNFVAWSKCAAHTWNCPLLAACNSRKDCLRLSFSNHALSRPVEKIVMSYQYVYLLCRWWPLCHKPSGGPTRYHKKNFCGGGGKQVFLRFTCPWQKSIHKTVNKGRRE